MPGTIKWEGADTRIRKLAWFAGGFGTACLLSCYLFSGFVPAVICSLLCGLSLLVWYGFRPKGYESPDVSLLPRHRRLTFQLFRRAAALFLGGTLISSILKSQTLASVFAVLENIVMLLLVFRMFSKNLYKRREENQKWVNWWWRVRSKNAGAKARHADKDHKYFTCKNCKTICRVPVGKGKIIITCPKCRSQIQAKT